MTSRTISERRARREVEESAAANDVPPPMAAVLDRPVHDPRESQRA